MCTGDPDVMGKQTSALGPDRSPYVAPQPAQHSGRRYFVGVNRRLVKTEPTVARRLLSIGSHILRMGCLPGDPALPNRPRLTSRFSSNSAPAPSFSLRKRRLKQVSVVHLGAESRPRFRPWQAVHLGRSNPV